MYQELQENKNNKKNHTHASYIRTYIHTYTLHTYIYNNSSKMFALDKTPHIASHFPFEYLLHVHLPVVVLWLVLLESVQFQMDCNLQVQPVLYCWQEVPKHEKMNINRVTGSCEPDKFSSILDFFQLFSIWESTTKIEKQHCIIQGLY